MTKVFIDTETTGLNRYTRRIWDVGMVIEGANDYEEEQFFIQVDTTDADRVALDIGRYFERHPDPYMQAVPTNGYGTGLLSEQIAAVHLVQRLRGALIIGAVPWFDMDSIEDLLHRYHLEASWHYHLVDVETLAAGKLGMRPPWNFDKVLAEFGLTYDEADRHTAIGDARMAKRLYEEVLK